ncbi:MAG: hypothetical protein IPO37_01135 [Saprospiraceae bacterium]|nr:hypothetical protein [Saprospiraceae bacterium]
MKTYFMLGGFFIIRPNHNALCTCHAVSQIFVFSPEPYIDAQTMEIHYSNYHQA